MTEWFDGHTMVVRLGLVSIGVGHHVFLCIARAPSHTSEMRGAGPVRMVCRGPCAGQRRNG